MIKIVAHRGAPKLARENTIEAFEAAVALGVDMVELDVRMTADGVPVIFHDPWISPTMRHPLLKELTYAELLRRTERRNFSPPTLDAACKALAGKTTLDVELKEPGYEKEVVSRVRAYFDASSFILTSFDSRILKTIKDSYPELSTGFILGDEDGLAACKTIPAEVIAPSKELFAAHRGFFAAAKARGARIAVWTVDTASQLSRLLADPVVDAIITNRPDRALALRDKLREV